MSAIKSDGGSSSYYDIELPEWLIDRILERRTEEGKFYIKTEEMILTCFGNDFDYGTLFKSLVRAYKAGIGTGKEGSGEEYNLNKILYYAEKIKETHAERK